MITLEVGDKLLLSEENYWGVCPATIWWCVSAVVPLPHGIAKVTLRSFEVPYVQTLEVFPEDTGETLKHKGILSVDKAPRKQAGYVEIINNLVKDIHSMNVKAGWWNDPESGESLKEGWWAKYAFFTKILLQHSELSEAMEGARKDLMDDKLPHRKMEEVELADAIIRIFDYAGAKGYDIGGAIQEKLEYNAQRAVTGDHSKEARLSKGGKLV